MEVVPPWVNRDAYRLAVSLVALRKQFHMELFDSVGEILPACMSRETMECHGFVLADLQHNPACAQHHMA